MRDAVLGTVVICVIKEPDEVCSNTFGYWVGTSLRLAETDR